MIPLIKNLISFFSIYAFASITVVVLVNNRSFDPSSDKLKVGAKVRVECSSSDSNSYAKVVISSENNAATGYLKGTATLEYTVKADDGKSSGGIGVFCKASRDGKINDNQKNVDLPTETLKERNKNPANLGSMSILVNNRSFDPSSDKLKVGAKVRVECSSSDSNSYAKVVISSENNAATGYLKGTATLEYTVKADDGKSSGGIGVFCKASRDGKINDNQKNVDLPTETLKERNKNPANLGSMKLEIKQEVGRPPPTAKSCPQPPCAVR